MGAPKVADYDRNRPVIVRKSDFSEVGFDTATIALGLIRTDSDYKGAEIVGYQNSGYFEDKAPEPLSRLSSDSQLLYEQGQNGEEEGGEEENEEISEDALAGLSE